jgi:predicted helicase
MTDIQHAHLYGMREAKYDWLSTHDVNSTDWKEVEPQKPFSLFIPQNNEFLEEYQNGWKISDAMPVNSTGVKTHRDHFVLDFDKSALQKRIQDFRDLKISDNQISEKYEVVDTRDWKLGQSRKSLAINQNWENYFTQCLYRPFDFRDYYHHKDVVELPRHEVMRHMLDGDNLGLIARRQMVGESITYFFASNNIISDGVIGADNKGRESFFLLYLYPDKNNPQTSTTEQQRRPNFSDEFLTEITNKLSYTPTPEAIFYYIYAIFHSPTYRTRYAEFLKIDFPRVPLTSDDQLFCKLGEYGEELVALHLMKSSKLYQPLTQIIDKGGEFVVDAGHPKFLPSPTGRGAGGEGGEVIINKKGDRFTGVPKSVWEFYVGGYQVCHKWLKDRKGRQLSPEDLNHYQKIIVALSETMQIMKAIDAAIPSFPIK